MRKGKLFMANCKCWGKGEGERERKQRGERRERLISLLSEKCV